MLIPLRDLNILKMTNKLCSQTIWNQDGKVKRKDGKLSVNSSIDRFLPRVTKSLLYYLFLPLSHAGKKSGRLADGS